MKTENWTEKQLTKEYTRTSVVRIYWICMKHAAHELFLAIIFFFLPHYGRGKWNDFCTWAVNKVADRNQWHSWFFVAQMNAIDGKYLRRFWVLALALCIQLMIEFYLCVFVFHSKPLNGWSACEMALRIHRINFSSFFCAAVIFVKCMKDFPL